MTEQASDNKGVLGWYFNVNLLNRILVGLIAGAAIGIFLAMFAPHLVPGFVDYTKFFGDVFIRLLHMIAAPVIFISLIVGVSSVTPKTLGTVGYKTMIYYLVTSGIAITIAIVVALILSPGAGMNVVGDGSAAERVAKAPPFSQVLLNIIPMSPVQALAERQFLPIVFFSIVAGLALGMLRDQKDELGAAANDAHKVLNVFAEIMFKIVRGVMQYAPIGVFVLIAHVFAQQGPRVIGPTLYVLFVFYVAIALHWSIGYCGLVKLFGLSPMKFLRGVREASITAFVTRSSAATLPVTMRCCTENLGVSRPYASFVLPVGATVNMDGTAIYLCVGAIFIANAIGMTLAPGDYVTLILIATLGAIGAAGVPGAGAIMMLMVLESMHMPVVAGSAVAVVYALILGIDALFDMGRTTTNVTGDVAGAGIVGKLENEAGRPIIDLSKWLPENK